MFSVCSDRYQARAIAIERHQFCGAISIASDRADGLVGHERGGQSAEMD
jgi:hypothetical protein